MNFILKHKNFNMSRQSSAFLKHTEGALSFKGSLYAKMR